MTTKLTLTIEDTIIESAKKYAKENGKSLSHLVSDYLQTITSIQTENDNETISPKILALMGVIKQPDDFDYKTVLKSSITHKYE